MTKTTMAQEKMSETLVSEYNKLEARKILSRMEKLEKENAGIGKMRDELAIYKHKYGELPKPESIFGVNPKTPPFTNQEPEPIIFPWIALGLFCLAIPLSIIFNSSNSVQDPKPPEKKDTKYYLPADDRHYTKKEYYQRIDELKKASEERYQAEYNLRLQRKSDSRAGAIERMRQQGYSYSQSEGFKYVGDINDIKGLE